MQSWKCWYFCIAVTFMDSAITYPNFNSKHHDKCTFVIKLITLISTSNLFSLEVVQKLSRFPAFCIKGKLY